ncbi:30S ribosomal protein S15 [Candidatus Peregrinibacteria bacterium CG10_big_fil_rev_8_21_14_0_10_36_19]|nr:MAG: 30S ribosomal protein S15 [Candidatus Peregrinibacteria bacterium CG10_big_fil_rev_8_21_14_0_10_36_19]
MKRESKKKVIASHSTHAKDTGSSQVQVAILTERINELSQHLETHPKDDHSRRGLLGLVGKRRKHLQYLRIHKKDDYETLIKKLNLRK